MKNFLLFAVFALCFACEPATTEEAATAETTEAAVTSAPKKELPAVVAAMETAHKATDFHEQEVVVFDLDLVFGGKKSLEATVSSTTSSDRVRVDLENGISIIYDGKQVYQTPADSTYARARFDIFTWQYFFMVPFKLNDPGTNWEATGEMPLGEGDLRQSAKLTFESGTGDAPDDWYIAYKEADTDRLSALAYIVTFGKTTEAAEAEPHAISYHNYKEVGGIPFATNWKFWMWYEETGLGDQIGEANISNIRLVKEADFTVPEDAKEVPL